LTPNTVDVSVEDLNAEAFSPFGTFFSSGWPSEAFAGKPNRMIDLGFSVDGTPSLYLIRYLAAEMVLTEFERHLAMTEARIALGAPASVLVVAAPNPVEAKDVLPDVESVRAFLIRPGTGLVLKRTTWHALDCFPVHEPFVDFAFISERESEKELEGAFDALERTQIVDFSDSGIEFRVSDPAGLLSSLSAVDRL